MFKISHTDFSKLIGNIFFHILPSILGLDLHIKKKEVFLLQPDLSLVTFVSNNNNNNKTIQLVDERIKIVIIIKLRLIYVYSSRLLFGVTCFAIRQTTSSG